MLVVEQPEQCRWAVKDALEVSQVRRTKQAMEGARHGGTPKVLIALYTRIASSAVYNVKHAHAAEAFIPVIALARLPMSEEVQLRVQAELCFQVQVARDRHITTRAQARVVEKEIVRRLQQAARDLAATVWESRGWVSERKETLALGCVLSGAEELQLRDKQRFVLKLRVEAESRWRNVAAGAALGVFRWWVVAGSGAAAGGSRQTHRAGAREGGSGSAEADHIGGPGAVRRCYDADRGGTAEFRTSRRAPHGGGASGGCEHGGGQAGGVVATCYGARCKG